MNRALRFPVVAGELAVLLLVLLSSSRIHSTPRASQDALSLDDSDWWSHLRTLEPDDENLKYQARTFPPETFTVLGIPLGEAQFTRAAAKLGVAPRLTRGDAATGREQACYVSAADQEKVYLIFEQGELESSFYLFSGGPAWQGSDRCVESKLVRREMTTGSGLRLGQSPAEVMAILGKPSKRNPDKLIYYLSVREKLSAPQLARLLQQHPQLSDKQMQEEYGFDLTEFVEARFVAGKLTYLSVSKEESN